MFQLLASVEEKFGFKVKKSTDFRDLNDPNQALTSIAFDLSKEINSLLPGQMISRKLQDHLSILSQEERTFLVDLPDMNGFNLLVKACTGRIPKVVDYLCRTCLPDLKKMQRWEDNDYDETRWAPVLWIAAVADHVPTVKVLLKAGADINAVSCTGSTPINSACFMELLDMVTFLLEAGADPNIPNNKGCTCLMNSIKCGDIFTLLLEHGADMYARDNFQKTVLHYAIDWNESTAITYLFEIPCDPFQVDDNDHKELLLHGAYESKETFKALLPILLVATDHLFHDAREMMGCTEYRELEESTYIDTWISVARHRRDLGLFKKINRPIPHFENRTECVSEQELRGLLTYEHHFYQILMTYMRVLGPTHWIVIESLHEELRNGVNDLFTNRIGFLLLKILIEKQGLFNEDVAKTSCALMHYSFELLSTGQNVEFEIYMESLMITQDEVEASRVEVNQMSELMKTIYDWALNFIISLVYFIKMSIVNQKQEEDFLSYIRTTLLVNGVQEFQLRTAKEGYTLLHLAVSKFNYFSENQEYIFPNLKVSEVLLSCGAPVNAASFNGSSPLLVAVGTEHYNREIVELLLDHGAHYDQVGPGDDTAIEVLKRCLNQANGALLPPENLPTVSSLQCLSAIALAKTGVDIDSDHIPHLLKDMFKLHARQHSVRCSDNLITKPSLGGRLKGLITPVPLF